MHEGSLLAGALATHELVGRNAELEALHAAIFPADPDAFCCLVLSAGGGLGKTRLLREVFERLTLNPASPNPNQGSWGRPGQRVVGLDLIDLADVSLHPVVGFLREVRERFGKALMGEAVTAFARFDKAWLAYEQARDGELDFAEVTRRTNQLLEAFRLDYAALSTQMRVVWILDTLEQLYGLPPEIAAYFELLQIESRDLGQNTYSWLLDDVIRSRPARTTLLLAGRPEPSRWLKEVQAVLPADALPPIELGDFSTEETQRYLEVLCAQLARMPNLEQRALALHEATNEPHEIANLQRLTGGNPIRLALYIDLFFNAELLPEPFGDPNSTATLSPAEVEALRARLDTDLLNHLTEHLQHPEPQVLEYLSVMRRGLDPARLKMLWQPDDDSLIDQTFERLQRLSFIKVRRQTLYLHDEFYSIYQRNLANKADQPDLQQAERLRQRDIFSRLIDYSQERALGLVQEAAMVQAAISELVAEEPPSAMRKKPFKALRTFYRSTIKRLSSLSPNYLAQKRQFRDLRAERRSFRVERLHYALYNDPRSGLNNLFFRIAGQAFLANELDLDELLQSEVSSFFFGANQELNRVQTGVDPTEWQLLRFHVVYERVARWIRRLTQLLKRDTAQELARLARSRHRELVARFYPDLVPLYAQPEGALIARLFEHEWDACRCFAAIYAGGELSGPINELECLIDEFEAVLRSDGLLRTAALKDFRWRTQNLLAECMHFSGFAHATLYEFKLAEIFYRRAKQILDKTGFSTLQSDVQNGLARVLGERGNLFEALALCEEALAVRERNGFELLRGLSRNTLALINTRNNRPTRAREHAEIALTIFRQLNNPTAIGLALIQLAEARRRVWNITADEVRNEQMARHRVDSLLLADATAMLDEAERLFADRSQARMAEILIERGCLYRDWAAFFGIDQTRKIYDQARDAYRKAMEVADAHNYPKHYVSACVNLTWLYARSGDAQLAEEMAARARSRVPEEYHFTTARSVNPDAVSVTFFRELSKLHALYAQVLVPDTNREGRLRQHIFAITAMQLFSPFNPYYLDLNKRQLASFITTNFPQPAARQELGQLTQQIIAEYHLDALRGPLKRLQAEEVVAEAITQESDDLDYLMD